MNRCAWLVAIVASLPSVQAHAAPGCRAVSEATTLPLVELYTSEGCDSCPPADRWLASRFAAGAGDAIALAYHVDYWDRLGWVDRFASAAYTERQYQGMRANGGTFVYTPQVLLQGHDFAAWKTDAAAIDAAARVPARAGLTLEADVGAKEVVVHADAQIRDRAASGDARLLVAYTDSGLVTDVKAGENRGVRLAHDHVVRALRATGVAGSGGRIGATLTLPKPREAGTHPTVVAFVQRGSTGDVLQALALPLERCASP